MSNHTKRLLCLLLSLVMILGMLPTVSFAAASRDDGGKNDEKKNSDEIWDTICRIEDEKIIATRGKNATARDYAAIVDDVIKAVEASDSYVEGSLERHGNFFFWVTEDGEPQGYSPSLRSRVRATAKENVTAEDLEGKTETVSFASKGGSPSSTNIAVFQPYYGLDSSFTTQYKEEGVSVASATGGTSTTYLTTNATITNIAAAMQSCAVVFFDSHGTTDYDGASLGYTYPDDTSEYVTDYVTQANSSYLCLQSNTGISSADQAAVTGTYGTYYHAFNGGSGSNGMKYYCVDGTAIANHMTQNAPNNFLWMAICLGMATDGLYSGLRAKGVEVVYGYSQSVSFYGDYAYEAHFWDLMKNGSTVKDAIASMKSTYGNWDPAYYRGVAGSSNNYYVPTSGTDSNYDTIGEARYYCVPFPNVVSSEDSYNGHRTTNPSSKTAANSSTYNASYGACNLQTVNSTWKLMGDPEPATVTLMAGSSTYSTLNTNTNTATTLPNYTGTVPTGYTFAGWATAAISGTTNTKPTLYNGSFTPSESSTTLYACFSKQESGSGGSSDDYELYTDSLTEGDYLVVYSNKAMKASIASNRLSYEEVTPVNDVITTTDATIAWHIAPDGNYWTFYNAEGYAAATSTNNRATLLSSVTDYALWSVTESSGTYDFVNKGNSRYLRENGTYGYAAYGNTTGGPLSLYKNVSGATYTYTTTITTCAHNRLTAHPANAATCTADGNTAYWSCDDCGALFSDSSATTATTLADVTIAALGHNYVGVVTAPTATEQGYTTYTCSRCNDSYVDDYVPALGETYTVSFSVPSDVSSISSMSCNNTGITLPTADNFTKDGVIYTFVGWVVSDVDNESTQPASILTGSYVASGNITLKALYTYAISDGSGNGGSGDYELASSLDDGDYVFGAVKGTVGTDTEIGAIHGELSGTWGAYTVVTPSDGKIASGDADDMFVWTLTNVSGGITLQNKSTGKYLSLPTGTGSSGGKPSFSDSAVTVYASSENSTNETFKLHPTSDSTNQLACNFGTGYGYRMYAYRTQGNATGICVELRFYKLSAGGSSTTYWTSVFGADCDHADADFFAEVSATCENTGTGAYWYCPDCDQYFADDNGSIGSRINTAGVEIPALGHDYQVDTASSTAATCTTAGSTVYVCSHDSSHTYSEPVPAIGHSPAAAIEENRVEATTSAAGRYDSVVYCSVCGDELSRETVVIPQIIEYTVTYHTPTGIATPSAVTQNSGTTITLPGEPSGTPEGYTFLGWTTQTYALDNTSSVTPVDNSYTVSADADLYALYTYSDGTGSGGNTEATDTITFGDLGLENSVQYLDPFTNSDGNFTVTFGGGGNDGKYYNTGAGIRVYSGGHMTIEAVSGTITGIVITCDSSYVVNGNGTCTVDSGTLSADGTSVTWTGDSVASVTFTRQSISGHWRIKSVTVTVSVGDAGTVYYTTEVANVNCDHDGTLEHVAASAASCTEDGNIEYWHCTDCGKYFSDSAAATQIAHSETVIAATGHTTGTAYGHDSTNHWQICTVCGEPCDVAAHTPDAGVYTAATFSTAGYWTYTCTVCDYTYTVEDANAPATGLVKTYKLSDTLKDGDKVIIVLPSENLAVSSTASGSKLSGVSVSPSNGTIGTDSEAIVFDVTIDGNGYITFTNGGKYLTSGATGSSLTLADEASDYSLWTLEDATDGFYIKNVNAVYGSGSKPQYAEYYNGFTTYSMNTGNTAIYTYNFYVLDTMPTFVGESLTVNGDILVNAVVSIPAGLAVGNSDLVVKIYDGDAATGTPIQTVSVSSADLVSQGYKFTVLKPAKEIQDNVTLVIYDGDELISMINSEDNQTVDAMSYSVQTYLDKVIGNADTYDDLYPGLSDLCKAMSDYGYYAQEQQGYKTDSLSHTAHDLYFTDEYDGVYDLIKDGFKYSRSKIGDGITAHSGSVVMLAQTAIRMYFAVTDKTATYTASVSFKNAEFTDVNTYWYSDAHEYYVVELRNIGADDFDEGFTVTLSDGNGNSATVTNYSVYSYVRQTLKNSTGSDPALDNVVKAIYVYGQKAEAYFN